MRIGKGGSSLARGSTVFLRAKAGNCEHGWTTFCFFFFKNIVKIKYNALTHIAITTFCLHATRMNSSDPTDYWPVVADMVSDNIAKETPIIVKVVARHANNCHAFAIVVVVLAQCTAKIAGQTLLSDPCEIPLSDPSSVGSIAIGVAASTLHWKCRHWRWWWGAAHPSLGSGVNELTMTSSGRVQQAEPAMTMMGHYTPASAVAAGGAPSLLGEWGCHAVGI